jgi:hypothetical protein
LLVIGLAERSVVAPGTTSVRVVGVNDRSEPVEGQVAWTVHAARSAVFSPDPDGARIGLPMPPDADAKVAIERSRELPVAEGTIALAVGAEATAELGTVDIALVPGEGRTLILRWDDPTTGAEENSVHLCCVPADATLGAGLSELS